MKNKINISLFIGVTIFLTVIVLTKLFKISDLPLQTIGAMFGAVITALITYFLLLGQSQAEETKERNVKVFEEKTKRYNDFINKLWDIWEDREVTLEELNNIIKLLSKDIILYTKQESTEEILTYLNEIAEYSNNDKIDNSNKIQDNIFKIINVLAREIDLGGAITESIQKKLDSLEKKVIPYLNSKKYKQLFIDKLNDELNSKENVPYSNAKFIPSKDKKEVSFIEINVDNSTLKVMIGPIPLINNRKSNLGYYFGDNINYKKYSTGQRKWRSRYLKGIYGTDISKFNFNDFSLLEDFMKNFYYKNEKTYIDNLVENIEDFYKTWKYDKKKIEEIITECES